MYQEHDVHMIAAAEPEGRDEHVAALPTSAQIRHESEVRTISAWSKERIRGFLEFAEQKRSAEAYQRLRADLIKVVGLL